MDYITVRQAAEKWGVTMRQVQIYLKDNRVDSALRPGHDWLIPADAPKPSPKREHKRAYSLSNDLSDIFEATLLPLPINDPDAVLSAVTDERYRLHYIGELAYLRGDFEVTKACFLKTGGDDASRLRASSVAIAAGISTGDYPFYLEVERFLKRIIQTTVFEDVSAFAELSLSIAYVSTLATSMIPGWLKKGDFTLLNNKVKPDAAYKRVKYFQGAGEFEPMLAIAETALSFSETPHGIIFHDVYFRIICAAALYALGRSDEARRRLKDAMSVALPLGFITPFAESVTAFGGMMEQLLQREYPMYYDAVIGQWNRTFTNWLEFHNRFTKNNKTLILSLRDYQIAQLAAKGVPNEKIAEQFHMPLERLENKMSEIYGELSVDSRSELAKYIL